MTIGYCEEFVAGVFERLFHPQPDEQRALGSLLAECDLGQAPNETDKNLPFSAPACT
jgi:hypothetical protein